MSIFEVADGEPASQTQALPQTNPQGSKPTVTVLRQPFTQVGVAAAHIIGSRTRWTIDIVPSAPNLALTAAYGNGRQFVANVDGVAAGMLYLEDERGSELGYAFIMGDHLQLAQAAAQTWTTQVTTTTRSP